MDTGRKMVLLMTKTDKMDTSEAESGLAGVAGYKQRMRELRINKELRKIKKKFGKKK